MNKEKIINVYNIALLVMQVFTWVCIAWMVSTVKITYTNDNIDQIIIRGVLVQEADSE